MSVLPRLWPAIVLAGLVVASSRPAQADGDVRLVDLSAGRPAPTAAELRAVLPVVSSDAVRSQLAALAGANEVAGKALVSKGPEAPPSSGPALLAAGDFDHWVSGDAVSILGQQRNPTIAVNPVDQAIVVAIAENTNSVTGNFRDCSLYASRNGGLTYGYIADLGLYFQTAAQSCASPKAVFSPDGKYLYVAYLELGTTFPGGIIDLQIYDALSLVHLGGYGFNFGGTALDSPSVGVHAGEAGGNADATYLVFTNFFGTGCSIEEFSFAGYLATFSNRTLALRTSCTGGSFPSDRLVQGPTVAAGPGTQVLACWFDSGIDGYSTTQQIFPPAPGTPVIPLNKFNIACRSSNDRGATWAGDLNPPESVTPPDYTKWIYAAKDVLSEVPYWMGPNAAFFSIAASQYPSLAIDSLGTAHLVFSYGIAANKFKSDNTGVAYVRSTAALPTATVPVVYSKWLPKTVLATGAGAQLFPTVATQQVQESPRPYVYVAWLDTAASLALGAANANAVYDSRYRLSTTGGASFGKATLLSDHASLSDAVSIGNYMGAAAASGIFHAVWTDNRAAFSRFQPRLHIFAERY